MATAFAIWGCLNPTWATEQEPDILHYQGSEFALHTGWGHPSPLEVYYHRNRLAPPFKWVSTGNYRGHVAVWEIADGLLYLKAIRIQNKDSLGNSGNLPAPPGMISGTEHPPHHFGIFSAATNSEEVKIVAEWFSGALLGTLWAESDWQKHYFHVRSGRVVAKGDSAAPVYERYVHFHFQLRDDEVTYGDEICRLVASACRPSPIFGFFGNSFLDWPYSWENEEKTGAPMARWSIIDDQLYLEEISLRLGSHIFEPETETVPLDLLVGVSPERDRIAAAWVNGVYLLKHGKEVRRKPAWADYTVTEFKISGYTFIRVNEGRVEARAKAPKDIFRNPHKVTIDPALDSLLQEWKLKKVETKLMTIE